MNTDMCVFRYSGIARRPPRPPHGGVVQQGIRQGYWGFEKLERLLVLSHKEMGTYLGPQKGRALHT